MKQSVNSVNIEGIVSEIILREIDKTAEGGKKFVAGEVIVQVADAEGKVNMIPVSFISADTKKDGTPNQNYARLMQLKEIIFQALTVYLICLLWRWWQV